MKVSMSEKVKTLAKDLAKAYGLKFVENPTLEDWKNDLSINN